MTESASRIFDQSTDRLDLPPGFQAIALRELGDAMAHAMEIAPERGAGTVVWVRRFDVIEFAVVLEPDEPLATARRAIYPAVFATVHALLADAMPEKPIEIDWPDTVLVDGGIIGGARLAWPARTREEDVPDWLVAGVQLRAVAPHFRQAFAPGAHPLDERFVRGTSMAAEGFLEIDAGVIVERFTRHLLASFDRWQSDGFEVIAAAVLARLAKTRGVTRKIDSNGDLIERKLSGSGRAKRISLAERLRKPGWIDPKTGEVWL